MPQSPTPIPYESEARLQDRGQLQEISQILGLDAGSLTNAELQAVPPGSGAGRVNKFREIDTPQQSRNGSTSAVDIEMSSSPAHPNQQTGLPRGYPALANFIGSDGDFFIFRRFNSLSARNLLCLQDELMELEEKLRTVDLADSRGGNQRSLWNLHCRREDNNLERKRLMAQVNEKLKAYQDALYSQSRVISLEKAPDIYADSLANWIDGTKPVVEPESHFLDNRSDLASLAGQQSSKELLERYLEKYWYRYFITKEHVRKSEALSHSKNVEFYSTTAIRRTARLILTFFAAIFLVVPLFILSHFHSPKARLGLITVFAFGFAAMLSVLTKSRTYEIFAAMAAYAAFLVVFVGNN